jgi:hypothetical protein
MYDVNIEEAEVYGCAEEWLHDEDKKLNKMFEDALLEQGKGYPKEVIYDDIVRMLLYAFEMGKHSGASNPYC